jgi:hypothetical protein
MKPIVFPETKNAGDRAEKNQSQDPTAMRVAQQTNTLMSLIKDHETFDASAKASRVVGRGSGLNPKESARPHTLMGIYGYSVLAQQQT